MKKKLIATCLILAMLLCSLVACGSDDGLTKVKLNEVAHSIFYAPMYVAIEKGYFAEEGLEVSLVNGLGADKTMTAVLSGDADIGFMGSEASIYVYNQGKEDYIVNFAQLTQRAGNFLVSRKQETNFDWNNLIGKTIIGGREGGMPQMVLEYILKEKGIDPENDVTIIQNIDFGLTGEAFASGTGDYTVEFEPAAYKLEKEGKGYVVASLGVESGMVPYTAYSAKKSYIEKNPEIIQSFTNAIQKGLEYVAAHDSNEIAKVIKPQFPDTDMDSLVGIVERYRSQDTWKQDSIFKKESFDLLQDILSEAGQLDNRVDYDLLVTTDFSKKAAK